MRPAKPHKPAAVSEKTARLSAAIDGVFLRRGHDSRSAADGSVTLSGTPLLMPVLSAVSGGSDSMALAHAAQHFADSHHLEHRAVIIDHGIRDNSDAEAQSVQAELSRHDIRSTIITVSEPAPSAGIQDWARRQRLSLLTSEARHTGAALLFGHQQDDQAETVMMRLARGSGLDGLRGMVRATRYQGVWCLRPFLDIRRHELKEYCQHHDLRFVSDPSNQDIRFERVRARSLLRSEEMAGMSRSLLRLSSASQSLSEQLRERLISWLAAHARYIPGLLLELPWRAYQACSPTVQARLLHLIITMMGPDDYPPSADSISRLHQAVDSGSPSTLGGCYVTRRSGQLSVQPEWGRKAPEPIQIAPAQTVWFDNRWLISSASAGQVMRYGSLSPEARAEFTGRLKSLPARVQMMIPVCAGLDGRLHSPHFEDIDWFVADAPHGAITPDEPFLAALHVSGQLWEQLALMQKHQTGLSDD